MCSNFLKRLWEAYHSPVTIITVRMEQRELKHKLRNTEAKVDSVLQRLMRDMREDNENPRIPR